MSPHQIGDRALASSRELAPMRPEAGERIATTKPDAAAIGAEFGPQASRTRKTSWRSVRCTIGSAVAGSARRFLLGLGRAASVAAASESPVSYASDKSSSPKVGRGGRVVDDDDRRAGHHRLHRALAGGRELGDVLLQTLQCRRAARRDARAIIAKIIGTGRADRRLLRRGRRGRGRRPVKPIKRPAESEQEPKAKP